MPKGEADIIHGPYRIRWTGWKKFPDAFEEVAQWVTVGIVDNEEMRIFASSTGRVDICKPGDTIRSNIVHRNVPRIDMFSTVAEREEVKAVMLDALVNFLDEMGKDGGIKPQKKLLQPGPCSNKR